MDPNGGPKWLTARAQAVFRFDHPASLRETTVLTLVVHGDAASSGPRPPIATWRSARAARTTGP
ncbi:hypothetical protein [Streptosporangium roseum]|uniref:hypothetical protein n=1 Tax=Streptosporangium roseum TaxID=2001 RepID=UPI0004CDBE47|nr:hypothetical protein [Streptosporangium roseum]